MSDTLFQRAAATPSVDVEHEMTLDRTWEVKVKAHVFGEDIDIHSVHVIVPGIDDVEITDLLKDHHEEEIIESIWDSEPYDDGLDHDPNDYWVQEAKRRGYL